MEVITKAHDTRSRNRRRKPAPENGVDLGYGAGFWSVCQGIKNIAQENCYPRSIPGIAGTVAAVGSRRHVRHGLGHRRKQYN